jgi:hypothetical protein
MGKRYCEVENCGTEIPEGRGSQGGLPICDACRHAQYYARKQGAAWLKARRERYHFFEVRLDYLLPHIGRMVADAKDRVAKAAKRVESRTH